MTVLHCEQIPTAIFRDRFLQLQDRDGLTYSGLARQLGYWERSGRPDGTRVRRELGLEFTPYDVAVRFCRALNLDPFECGI